MPSYHALTRAEYERELDATLAGSFPASDPPPWTFGASSWMAVEDTVVAATVPAVVDAVYHDSHRAGRSSVAGLGEAIALAATVPLAILIAGVPVVTLIWGIVRVIDWLTRSG